MRTERIESPSVIKEGVLQLTPPIQAVNTQNLLTETKEADPKQNLTPTQNAILQREATAFKRNNNFLFILPKQYTYDVFEGNGVLDPKGNFIVLVVGPFGSGKNSLVNNALNKASDSVQQVIEHTSRQKRAGETEGVEYHFVTKDEFERMAKNDEILVWGYLTGNYYGYSIKSIQEALNSKKTPILIQGPTNAGPMKNALEKRNIPVIVAFISPLSQEELSSEGGIDRAIEILEKRMENTERNKLKERSIISRAMFESLPDIALIENSAGNLEKATVNLLSLIQVTQVRYKETKKGQVNPRDSFIATGKIPDEFFTLRNLKANGNIAVLVTGPSGAGKGTILNNALKDESISMAEAISSTTRSPRQGEVEGVDYYFVSMEEFKKKIENNELLEWAEVHNGKFYGYTEKQVQKLFDSSKNPVFELDVIGAKLYKEILKGFNIPCIDIFISPVSKEDLTKPSGIDKAIEILRERITKRAGGETEAQIEDRMKIARNWLKEASTYSHIIENVEGNPDKAISEFIGLIKSKIEESKKN